MKEKYLDPEMEIICFEMDDIITSSPTNGDVIPGTLPGVGGNP